MLYKKIHRQYVKEFRVGRKFMWCGDVCRVTGKPNIDYSEGSICVSVSVNISWSLIVINDNYFGDYSIGERLDKDNITWLN